MKILLLIFLIKAFFSKETPSFFKFDLPLLIPNKTITDEISKIYIDSKKQFLNNDPSLSNIISAYKSYKDLNIIISNKEINGKCVTSFEKVEFFSTFIEMINTNKYNNTQIIDIIEKVIWFLYDCH